MLIFKLTQCPTRETTLELVLMLNFVIGSQLVIKLMSTELRSFFIHIHSQTVSNHHASRELYSLGTTTLIFRCQQWLVSKHQFFSNGSVSSSLMALQVQAQ